MSKDIKVGSWWLDEEGDIVYVAFNRKQLPFTAEEDDEPIMVWHNCLGEAEARCLWIYESFLIRELPGCTGFDYKEPIVAPNNLPHNPMMDGPPQWIPVTVGGGDQYLLLGYQCQPVDATAG